MMLREPMLSFSPRSMRNTVTDRLSEFIVDGARHDGFSGTGRTGKSEESFALQHTLNELAKQFAARAHDERGRIECLPGGRVCNHLGQRRCPIIVAIFLPQSFIGGGLYAR